MWKNLSLRARLFLPLGVLFLTALLIGSSALEIFSPAQFVYENEPEREAALAVAKALNDSLQASVNPRQTLDAFAASLGTTAVIQFHPADGNERPPTVRTASAGVPKWFVDLLTIPDLGSAHPISIGGRHVGDIVFLPNISADIFEKWIGFLAITLSAAVLMSASAGFAYFTAGAVLHPLLELGNGLSRMRSERYGDAIPVTGPPEIRRSCVQANELASMLSRLSDDNRKLLHKIVSLQDDERQRLARDLHDELGPLLFAIRANSIVLLETVPLENVEMERPLQIMLQTVEALQLANRRILEGLHPLYLNELGLSSILQSLLKNIRSQAPDLEITSHIDPGLNDVDSLLSQTVYRVLQEGMTNVLRHAEAKSIDIGAEIRDGEIILEVIDDGVGIPPDISFGRGLAGMRERVRALSGSLELFRKGARTIVRCRLPLSPATVAVRAYDH
jgi:two-component system, NarL family, sensor histidine kinase UhpB